VAGVKIVVDSTCDLPREMRESHDITMVPLRVHFDPEVYLDYIEMSPSQFYEKLRTSKVHPRTSQPSPAEFAEVYARLGSSGDEIISIHLSEKMSGTLQSAVLGKSMVEGVNVHVVDSRSASLGTGLMAVAAARAAREGRLVPDILSMLERIRRSMELYFVVDTLDYLARNGRIGRAQHLLGSLLQFKPILTIDEDGYVSSFEKVRGKSRAFSRLMEIVRERVPEGAEIVAAAVHSEAPAEAERLVAELGASYNIREKVVTELGPVIGSHVGPGTVAVMCYETKVLDVA
jgi:DegV family protein with EDD domain